MKNLLIKILILSLSISLIGCVSTNVPKKVKKAQKKLAKHATGIKNILNVYPELADSLRTTVHDTITIASHTADTTFIAAHDTAFVDKILLEFLSGDSIITIEKIRYIRNQIIKNVLKDTTYTYEDSLIHSTFVIKGGKFYYKSTIKEKKIPYVKEETTVNLDCEVEKPPYKYWWFYLMLIIILFLLYINVRK